MTNTCRRKGLEYVVPSQGTHAVDFLEALPHYSSKLQLLIKFQNNVAMQEIKAKREGAAVSNSSQRLQECLRDQVCQNYSCEAALHDHRKTLGLALFPARGKQA